MCVMNVCDECVLLQASRSALARNLSQQYGEMTVKLKQGENRESALLRKNKKLKERLTKLAAEHAALTEQLTDHHVKTGLKQQELDELYLHKSRETSMLSEIALLKTQLEQRNRDQERWTQELAKLRTLQARLVEEAGMSARQVEEYRSRLQQQGAQRTDYSDSQLTSERERRMAAGCAPRARRRRGHRTGAAQGSGLLEAKGRGGAGERQHAPRQPHVSGGVYDEP
jgi:acetyl/propionyl-CoA carboxylase alpha subunit